MFENHGFNHTKKAKTLAGQALSILYMFYVFRSRSAFIPHAIIDPQEINKKSSENIMFSELFWSE